MKGRDVYSWVAIALVITGESFALCCIRDNWHTWWPWTLLTILLLVTLWIVGIKQHHRFSVRSVILTKLLANAIVPRRLGTIYLLFFVIHIGWLTNTAMSLYNPNENLLDVLISFGICIMGILSLIIFFPNGGEQKDDNPTKVFISGISSINFSKKNLLPIVRMLQLTNNDNDHCELLVLHSNYYSDPQNIDWVNKNFKEYFNYAIERINDENLQQKIRSDIVSCNNITMRLKLLLKMVALAEFPQKKWIFDNLKITFSEQCDYETFDSCFNTLDKLVKERDTTQNLLFFNLTPGTVNVGALMTLMAIDGLRKLYYYIPKNEAESQKEESEDEKSKRLVEVKKKDIPLKGLLSQALDSFETENIG